MTDSLPLPNEPSTHIEQLGTIFRIQEIFGLHPYHIRPTGSMSFKVVTLPLGFSLYLIHGVLFVYCLIENYKFSESLVLGAISTSPMSIAQEIVSIHIHIVMYILCYIGMTQKLRMFRKMSILMPVMNLQFIRIGLERKPSRVSSVAKSAMIWYCFSDLIMFAYYLYFKRPSIQEWLPDYSLHLVTSMAIQCSIWSYMMYVLQVKAFQDELNTALLLVARSETEGPVKRVWTSNYVV